MRVGRRRCAKHPYGVVSDEPLWWLGRSATASTEARNRWKSASRSSDSKVFADGVEHESLAAVELAELHRSHRGRSTWRTAASVGSERQ
jgi:hypothetical protein